MARYSKLAEKYLGHKISKLKDEGYEDQSQRTAIALSMARKKGLKVPDKKD